MADTKAPPETTSSPEGAPEGRSGGSTLRRVGMVLALLVVGGALLAHKLGGGALVVVLIAAVALFLLFLLLRYLPRLRKHFGSTGKRVRTRRTRTTRTRRLGPSGAGARRGMPGKGLLSSRRGGGRAGAGGKGLSGTRRKGSMASGGRAGRAGGTRAGSFLARRGGAKGGASARKGLARRSKTGTGGTGGPKAGGTRRGILGRKGGAKGTGPGTGRRKGIGTAGGRGSRSLRHPLGGKRNARTTGPGGRKSAGSGKGGTGRRGNANAGRRPGRRFIPFRGRRPGGASGGKGSGTGSRPGTTGKPGTKGTPKKRWSPKSRAGKAAWWTLGLPLAGAAAAGGWAWRKGKAKSAARKAARARHAPPPRGHKAQPGTPRATGKQNHRWIRAAGARYRRARSTYRRWAPWSRTTPASHAAPKVTLNRPRWHRRAWSRAKSWRPWRRKQQRAPFRYYVRQPTQPLGGGTPAGTGQNTTGPRMPDPAPHSQTQDPPPAGRGPAYHPGGTSTMHSPIAQATEAVQEAIGSYDPEHMAPVGDWLNDLPEFFTEQGNALQAMITRLREEYPLEPAVADHYESLLTQLHQMAEHSREGIGIYEAAHEHDLARQREPRTNEQAWDVSNNPNG